MAIADLTPAMVEHFCSLTFQHVIVSEDEGLCTFVMGSWELKLKLCNIDSAGQPATCSLNVMNAFDWKLCSPLDLGFKTSPLMTDQGGSFFAKIETQRRP